MAMIITLQGLQNTIDFIILPLRGCDLVLGAYWLQSLGPILWVFSQMKMSFTHQGRAHQLHGLQTSGFDVLESTRFVKQASNVGKGIMLHLISL